MISLDIFKENTIEDLKSSVNTFLHSLNDTQILDVKMTENEYYYTATVLYVHDKKDDDDKESR